MAETLRFDNLKELLGLKDAADKDPLVKFALNSAEEIVLNYCNIKEIPDRLSNTVLRMAMDIYRNEQPGEEETPQVVKSITVGDTSTSYGSGTDENFAKSLAKNYRSQLNRYRRGLFV